MISNECGEKNEGGDDRDEERKLNGRNALPIYTYLRLRDSSRLTSAIKACFKPQMIKTPPNVRSDERTSIFLGSCTKSRPQFLLKSPLDGR
jgi:hypothetical protein